MPLTNVVDTDDNPGMDDRPDKRGSGAVAIVLVAVLILLPILYVLSVGPVAWLDSNDSLNEPMHSVAVIVYFPLSWAVNNGVPIVGPALAAYVEWWES